MTSSVCCCYSDKHITHDSLTAHTPDQFSPQGSAIFASSLKTCVAAVLAGTVLAIQFSDRNTHTTDQAKGG